MIFRAQPSDRLRNLIADALDEPWLGACRPLIIDVQSVAMGRHGCPDVSVRESLAHLPTLTQEFDLSCAIHSSDEVNPTGRNGQFLRDLLALSAGQPLFSHSSAGLCRCQATERWGMILTHVPGEKFPALSVHLLEGAESQPLPETLRPQAMDALDQRVALGLCRRNEDQLYAEVEAETNKRTEPARGLVPSGGGGVIVELERVGQAQCLPGLQGMAAQTVGALVVAEGLRKSMSAGIDGVKDEEFLSACEIAHSPVREMSDGPGGQRRLRVIDLLGRGRVGLDESGGFEPTVDGGERRRRIEQSVAGDLLPNSACPDQPDLTSLERLADSKDHLSRPQIVSLRRTIGSCGSAGETSGACLFKPLDPSEQPDPRARNALEDVCGSHGFEVEFDSFLAPREFFCVVHTASFAGSMESGNVTDVVSQI